MRNEIRQERTTEEQHNEMVPLQHLPLRSLFRPKNTPRCRSCEGSFIINARSEGRLRPKTGRRAMFKQIIVAMAGAIAAQLTAATLDFSPSEKHRHFESQAPAIHLA